ncbi:MAG: translation initiation factor IF-5A, partial [Thermoplasmata archaeon]|nr:translation initiation factor IF-5A [Thermoplasmata archaeon]
HGEAKSRVEGVSIFDGSKKSFVHPVSHKCKIPMIDKRAAQVLAFIGEEVQLMDLVSYETFNIPIPEEFKDDLKEGAEIQYLVAMDRKKITRV